ncbi:probable F420-dependent oxidoreductase, MSMEG_2256 family [Parafrankia irregularis]|uniref:Probable F420-dependent oxidoreductase, MSMEG_2256 family n=1 Tax=Parafrankia irregularis TaxID=795642 RepID=A0A0S4QVW8_9ACTN|nr:MULTISPECIES: TIGR03617 family F420-dependent LLM class oxidoreductase [Parafrankia]MBE3200364.1 TIGR03617 family F420-dependent LLM class oxidoreductase [Parafrankia sp. CH37]CUU59792.1 probable F420-dependent oxidoreductase, MSMEG_2256 family [Parafrankia irregularis]
MRVDANIGGAGDGVGDATISAVADQVHQAERVGFDGVWAPEINRDPFLPLLIAADRSSRLDLGSAIAVAFARNPMSTAMIANDLAGYSSGRFILGLGSQVRPHIERRFGMPWSAPAARMREFVLALRAIWRSWYDGEPLDFRGEIYQHTLMTPMFSPRPNPLGPPPVMVAAVGPKMTAVAAEVADGMLIHGFTTERYLREVTVPEVKSVLHAHGRSREQFTLSYPGFVVTGADERSIRQGIAATRRRIAFYGSTPAYRGVLDLHGWGDLHVELHRLSRRNEWAAMADLVDDTVLNAFAVVGEPAEVAKEIRRRFEGLVDRFTLYLPDELPEQTQHEVVAGIRAR